jgi:hypothetical protein
MKRIAWATGLLLSSGMMFAGKARAQADAAPTTAPAVVGDTWKVTGDVQGTAVSMTCILSETDHKLTGSCSGVGDDAKPKALTGETTEKGLSWKFDSAYQGSPITLHMAGSKSADGTKMTGTIAVDPMGVDGTFTAVKQ